VQYYLRNADLCYSQELRKRIGNLAQRHELSNIPRLHRASAQQIQLTHRLLRLVQHLHLLIPTLRSSSIRPEEEALRAGLEEIDEEIRRPGGMGRMRGKLNELWALIGAVKAVRERGVSDGNVEWAVVDEEGLAQIAQVRFSCCISRFCGDLTTFFRFYTSSKLAWHC
jgi:nuclear pore complex protein Nup54